MLKIVAGERPVRPQGTQELGLVDSVWNMMVDCWQQDPARRPTTVAVVWFLREWSVASPHRIYVLICLPQLHATRCEPSAVHVGPMEISRGHR